MEVKKIIKAIIMWCIIAFVLLLSIGLGNILSWVFCISGVLLILPVEKWQNLIQRFLKNKIRIIIAVVLFVLMFSVGVSEIEAENTTQTESTEAAVTEELTSDAELISEQEITNSEEISSLGEEQTEVEKTTKTENITVVETTTKAEITTKAEVTTKAETTTKEEVTTKAEITTKAEVTTSEIKTTVHSHVFLSATCTEPEKCSCGATGAGAKGHSFANGKCSECGVNDPDYSEGPMVWIPKSGSKYHILSDCSGMKNPKQITLSEAQRKGIPPCSNCIN